MLPECNSHFNVVLEFPFLCCTGIPIFMLYCNFLTHAVLHVMYVLLTLATSIRIRSTPRWSSGKVAPMMFLKLTLQPNHVFYPLLFVALLQPM